MRENHAPFLTNIPGIHQKIAFPPFHWWQRAMLMILRESEIFCSCSTSTRRRSMKKITTALLACALLTTASASPADPNLVALWRGESNAQDSARRHDGTVPFGLKYAVGNIGE